MPDRPESHDESKKSDKVPALILAARRARDDETALLLLQKAKQIDPRRIEVYLLRAEIYERRGDDQRESLEYQEALDIDPTSWIVRFRILNLEYPRTRNLKHAAGIVRDLAWQKGFPERLFNASRGELRSESELGHDEALLGHLALAGRPGYGKVELVAVAANGAGDVFVLNAFEPWLERFLPDGTLAYGVDLWLTDDEDLAQRPTDVAGTPAGVALVAEPRAGRVLRFGPEGRYLGTLGTRSLPEPCLVAVAKTGGPALVVCPGDGTLRRFDPATGKAMGRAKLAASIFELRWGGLAAGPGGTAYVLAGDEIHVIPAGARKEAGRIPLPKGARRPAARRGRPPRRGIDFDPRDGTLMVVAGARAAIVRVDESGREVERLGGKGVLHHPRDVAVDGAGAVTVADFGNARVVRRPGGGGEWAVILGGKGWDVPK